MKYIQITLTALMLLMSTVLVAQVQYGTKSSFCDAQNDYDSYYNPNDQDAYYDYSMSGDYYSNYYRPVMRQSDFYNFMSRFRDETFDDDKLNMVFHTLNHYWFTSAQIAQINKEITFDSNQILFLTRAYDKCVDQRNYFVAVNSLTFSMSKDEVWEAINVRDDYEIAYY